jgi:hypothetical protein
VGDHISYQYEMLVVLFLFRKMSEPTMVGSRDNLTSLACFTENCNRGGHLAL